ncbi:hypothetical protein MASR2M70_07580 [Bacillota bacterium]
MDYIKYARTFVMMEEQAPGFAAGKSPAKGYLKIETGNNKGALRCVVQNIKYYSKGEYIYKLIMFGKNRGGVVNTVLGGLAVNRYGNGETYFRFDPLNMDGKGSCFSDFSVAVIAAVSGRDEKETPQTVLKGTMKKSDETVREEYFEETITQEPEPEKTKNYNFYYNEYLLQFCRYTSKSADCFEDVFPFNKDITEARWKRMQNVASLPVISPGAHHFATLYRHFLFGVKTDRNGSAGYYYFAVPGRFMREEQPDGGRSGFVFWQPVAGDRQESGAGVFSEPVYGYWIVAVDAKTGDIIEAG